MMYRSTVSQMMQQNKLQQYTANQCSNNQICNRNKYQKQVTYKIKDGLYLGTSIDAFYDQQFILLNYIQHIIVFQDQKNVFDSSYKFLYGQERDPITQDGQQIIKYLHVNQNIFSQTEITPNHISQNSQQIKHNYDQLQKVSRNSTLQQAKRILARNVQQIFKFIQEANSLGQSCLILLFSKNQSTVNIGGIFTLTSSYLMYKYKWSLYKSLQYLNYRVKGVFIEEKMYKFLNSFQVKLIHYHTLTYNWKNYQNHQELVIRNTFLNSQNQQITQKNESFSGFLNTTSSKNLAQKQKSKSKSKFEIPRHKNESKLNVIQRQSIQSSSLKSILKKSTSASSQKSHKKHRIQIKTQLNKIKQYIIEKDDGQQLKRKQQQVNKDQIITKDYKQSQKNHLTTHFQFSASRSRQISLSVRSIVTNFKASKKYKERSVKSSGNLYLEDYYQPSVRKLNKYKSVYNMNINQYPNIELNKSNKQNIKTPQNQISQHYNIQQKKHIPQNQITLQYNMKQKKADKNESCVPLCIQQNVIIPKFKIIPNQNLFNVSLLNTQKQNKENINFIIKKQQQNRKQDQLPLLRKNSYSQIKIFTKPRKNSSLTKLTKQDSILVDNYEKRNHPNSKQTIQNNQKRPLIKQSKSKVCKTQTDISLKQNNGQQYKQKIKNQMQFEQFKNIVLKKQRSTQNINKNHKQEQITNYNFSGLMSRLKQQTSQYGKKQTKSSITMSKINQKTKNKWR